MRRYGAILAYDGTAYQGFQRQPAPAPTIQAEVERAIGKVTGRTVGVLAAGRTDAGVHAAGQAIAFDTDWRHGGDELLRAINSQLPLDIALQRIWRQDGFHPRFDARWRQYAYRISTPRARQPLRSRFVWQLLGESLDIARMNEAARLCLGERDFAAFGTPPQAGSANTARKVYRSNWELEAGERGATFCYRIRGSAFLYHMVRRLVGMMTQVGRGKISPAEFEAILNSRDISQAKTLAPAQGLTLEAVGYPRRTTEIRSRREAAAKEPALEGET